MDDYTEGILRSEEEAHISNWAEIDAVLGTDFAQKSREFFNGVKTFMEDPRNGNAINKLSDEEIFQMVPPLGSVKISWLKTMK